jgi:hypothetical protein
MSVMTERCLLWVPGVQDTPAVQDVSPGGVNDRGTSVSDGGLPGNIWGDERRSLTGHTLRSGVVSLEHWLDLNA